MFSHIIRIKEVFSDIRSPKATRIEFCSNRRAEIAKKFSFVPIAVRKSLLLKSGVAFVGRRLELFFFPDILNHLTFLLWSFSHRNANWNKHNSFFVFLKVECFFTQRIIEVTNPTCAKSLFCSG